MLLEWDNEEMMRKSVYGLVGPAKGSKPRDVLVKLESSEGEEE